MMAATENRKGSRTLALLEACAQGDETKLAQLGWRDVLDALRSWAKRLGGDDLAPYARLLGDEDPAAITAAIEGLAATSEYRPAAAQVYVRLLADRGETVRARARQGTTVRPRPDNSPEAYLAVLDAIDRGDEPCYCALRPPDVTIDFQGVLRCPQCGCLELGQYDQALLWGDDER